MTRMEAVNWLNNIMSDIGKSQHRELWHYEQALAEIRELLEEDSHWIPCSERLPHGSCSDLVNVSIHDDSGDTPFDYTSCGWVTTDGEYWIVDNEINNHVIAWMPLPKPYGGENDG